MAAPAEITPASGLKHLCVVDSDESYALIDEDLKTFFTQRTIEFIPGIAKIGAFFDHTASSKVAVLLAGLPWEVSRFNGK